MDLRGKFTHIFFDADDTLWENEQFFRDAEAQFAELLSDYTGPEGVQQMLWRKQEENIPLFGYGSKTYMIGMTDSRYFSRCFKKHYGMSPADYIKQNKNS